MKLSESEFQQVMSRAAIAKRNPVGGEGASAVSKRRAGNAPHADRAVKASNPRKRIVRVTCFRAKHLQDPDNGIYKWHIDAIRRANLVDDDTSQAIRLEICDEVKVDTLEEERTEIEIEMICSLPN